MPMKPNPWDKEQLNAQVALQNAILAAPPNTLEHLAAALVGRLIDVPILVARTGFQHGGDAGPAGRQGRRFRIEAKRYTSTSSLNERELLGEMDQALARDEALEAWILVTTRPVHEQLAQSLIKHGELNGVPVVILDWNKGVLSPLAALCATAPDIVRELIGPEAAMHAAKLTERADAVLEQVRRELQSWSAGFAMLRERSHAMLESIWNNRKTSAAELGQDAAVGALQSRIRREQASLGLTTWWTDAARRGGPAVAVGLDGVGKTWATIDWLHGHRDQLPITLLVPASAISSAEGISMTFVKRLLADRLSDLAHVRDSAHWLRRLERLLSRPAGEGPVILVLFDGMNQQPSIQWVKLLQVLQGETFERRVCALASTRQTHLERLGGLRALVQRPTLVDVNAYDLAPGGEFDQMLANHGLQRSEIHPDLVAIARVPRLFDLVVKFRDRLGDAGQVTVHRLLWEYGRDTAGIRAQRSFTENEWREWLQTIARDLHSGLRAFSLRDLSHSAARPDLTVNEVDARLSDIIDGRFATPAASGALELSPAMIAHALGAALLHFLHRERLPCETVEVSLTAWLDPIRSLDEQAEILRAAVSIAIESGSDAYTLLLGELVTAWLQSQNLSDAHRLEINSLAPSLVTPLLDAVAHSDTHTHISARLDAVNALRSVPRDNDDARLEIIARLRTWFSQVSRDIRSPLVGDAASQKARADWFIRRIGTYENGAVTILGLPIDIVDDDDNEALQKIAPSLLEGYALAGVTSVFEAAIVAACARGKSEAWDDLKWLCLLNERDPHETSESLRALSRDFASRPTEPGIHADLAARASSLALWLTGDASDENAALGADTGFDRDITYEKYYLSQPSRGWYELEQRHVAETLLDREVNLLSRLNRTRKFWVDPTFVPPSAFVAEAVSWAQGIDVTKLDRASGNTAEDHTFEEAQPSLARMAPQLLADMVRSKLRSIGSAAPQERYWAADGALRQILLAGPAEQDAARDLRLAPSDNQQKMERTTSDRLLEIEILDKPPAVQVRIILAADPEFITIDLAEGVAPLSADDIDAVLMDRDTWSSNQTSGFVGILSVQNAPLSESAWRWVEAIALDQASDSAGGAIKALCASDKQKLGRRLDELQWSWSASADVWTNHYGAKALINATLHQPFEEIVGRLPPSHLLYAVRQRGATANEVRLAAAALSVALFHDGKKIDPGADLSVNLDRRRSDPSVYTISAREDETADPITSFREMFDTERRTRNFQSAVATARARVSEARAAGASLYLTNINPDDFVPVLHAAGDAIVSWLEGLDERTEAFLMRMHLAEGVYLSLCKMLLAHQPARGVELWRALREHMHVRYVGLADVDELAHIVFRAPASPEIEGLKQSLFDLSNCHTDQALHDICVAARFAGQDDFLRAVRDADTQSPILWRRLRGEVICGFIEPATLPYPPAWPVGEVRGSFRRTQVMAARSRWREACAAHWWRAFVEAETAESAYAAYLLFVDTADWRTGIAMPNEPAIEASSPLERRKRVHLNANRQELKRAFGKSANEKKRQFLGRPVGSGQGPWFH